MGFILGIASGVATYQFLFKIMGLDDDFSGAFGWLVGIVIMCFSDSIAAYISNKGNSKDNKMKLRIKALELEVKVYEQKEAERKRVQKNMDFFKKDKEMDM